MRPYIGKVPIDIYGSVVYVYTDFDKYKRFRGEDDREVGGQVCYYTDECNEFHLFVNDPDCLATITHESAHAVFGLLRHRGVVLCVESEESFTYLLGYVVSEVHKCILKHQQKEAKKQEGSTKPKEGQPKPLEDKPHP